MDTRTLDRCCRAVLGLLGAARLVTGKGAGRWAGLGPLALALALLTAACGASAGAGSGGTPCGIDSDCPPQLACVGGVCTPRPTADGGNAAADTEVADAAADTLNDAAIGSDAAAEPDGADDGTDASSADAIGADADSAAFDSASKDSGGTDAAWADVADVQGPAACKSAYDCDDGDLCTGDSCVDGTCDNGPKAAGCCVQDAECEDGKACTVDQCVEHKCVTKTIGTCCQIGLQCDDADPCTDDLCDAGLCTHSAVPGCTNGGGGGGGSCGDGACDAGEGCLNCAQDCGACGGCGDGACGFGEDCQSCSQDCGTCSSGQCAPGSSKCCTPAGTFAPKGTECGISKLNKTYSCSDIGNGSDILLSYKVGGCVGTSTLCSTASTYAIAKVETYKSCPASQKCQISSPSSPGTCAQGDKCTPGTKCCPNGQYAPKGTACGTSVFKKVYSCSGATKGATIYVQEAMAGCTGNSTTCSTSSTSLSWSGQSIYKKCSSTQYCKISSTGSTASCSSTP